MFCIYLENNIVYKNFKITEQEKQEILESHISHGYRKPLNESDQQPSKLTTQEQTLLGFLSRFLKGEKGEFKNTPLDQLEKTLMFNTKTIYPMVQKLIEKKNTGNKTYDDKTFNALLATMNKTVDKDSLYDFFIEGGKITNVTYNAQY
jgi:hypothetical protein